MLYLISEVWLIYKSPSKIYFGIPYRTPTAYKYSFLVSRVWATTLQTESSVQRILYNYSTCCTNRVLTRSVYQPRVYALGAPTTRLRVWCTPGALTNQGGGASVYRPRSLPYRIDSHYYPNEHTILHVFRAPGSDSLVLLN